MFCLKYAQSKDAIKSYSDTYSIGDRKIKELTTRVNKLLSEDKIKKRIAELIILEAA